MIMPVTTKLYILGRCTQNHYKHTNNENNDKTSRIQIGEFRIQRVWALTAKSKNGSKECLKDSTSITPRALRRDKSDLKSEKNKLSSV